MQMLNYGRSVTLIDMKGFVGAGGGCVAGTIVKILGFPIFLIIIGLINWSIKKNSDSKRQLWMGTLIAVFLIIYNLVWKYFIE